jgi:hypothetical protein
MRPELMASSAVPARGRPAGLIPGDGTSTTLGSWGLDGLMDQLDAIYPDGSRGTPGLPEG